MAEENKDLGITKLSIFTPQPGEALRSKDCIYQCSACKKVVESKNIAVGYNLLNYLFCYYYGGYWKCFSLVKGKDFYVRNAIHTCKDCGKDTKYDPCDLKKTADEAEKTGKDAEKKGNEVAK